MFFISAKPNDKCKLKIQFENFVGNDLLKLDSAVYKNSLGQTFTVSKFKYYISNIHLKNKKGTEFISKEFFLVNDEEVKSKQILLNDIPEGEYTAISFILGVDSLHNCSGVQKGALDPINGMFWAWNTGYVFMKIEGHAPQSISPGNIFEFHIGGFQGQFNALRDIKMAIGNWQLATNKENNLKIKVDAAEIFKTPNEIDFAYLSSVTDNNNNTIIADNYVDMFSVIEVK